MSITQNELQWFKAAVNDDTTANGGRMTGVVSTSGVKNNIWPDVSQAERAAGSTKYRKAFIKVANDDDFTLFDGRVYVETYTPADDSIAIFIGTQRDTQNTITGSERLYGSGGLNSNVIASATEMDVLTEGVAFDMFQNGDLIRISDKTDVNDISGNEEFVTISGAPVYAGDVATITFTPALVNAYTTASLSRVASVIEQGDVFASFDSFVVSSVSGTFDEVTNPIVLDNISTVDEDITFTFTSPTAYDVTGDTLGALGSGNISSNFSPNNATFSKPYFTLHFAGFGGTFAISDSITFTIHPAAVPVWYKRIVPVGANSFAGNKVIVAIDGESA